MTLERMIRMNERWLSNNIARHERELRKIYQETYDEIREQLAKTYEKYAKAGKLTNAEMTKYNRLTSLEKELNQIAGHGTLKARGDIQRLTREQYEESYFRYSWAMDNEIGVRANWAVLRPEAVKAAISNRIADIAKERLRQVTRERIQRTVAQGLLRGDSFDKMAREMRKGLTLTAKDAMRIARTEGGRAQSLGTNACYEEARDMGIEFDEEWSATLDDRTRDSHGAMDGVKREEEGFPFPGVGFVEGPRLTGVAEEDINCRCTVIPIVIDAGPRLRRDRERGIVPYQTYAEWKKGK